MSSHAVGDGAAAVCSTCGLSKSAGAECYICSPARRKGTDREEARLKMFWSVLDGKPGELSDFPPPVCPKCNGMVICRCCAQCGRSGWCDHRAELCALQSQSWTTMHQPKPIQFLPPGTKRPSAADSTQPPKQCVKRQLRAPDMRMPQYEVESILKMLDNKTNTNPRTKKIVGELVQDCNFEFKLEDCAKGKDSYPMAHMKEIIGQLPRNTRYRVGMTFDPGNRFYKAPWAYSKSASQNRDNVNWSKMLICHIHHCRHRIAMLEHATIDAFCRSDRRMKNKRRQLDEYERFDQDSDEDKEENNGPCFCYVVIGHDLYRDVA